MKISIFFLVICIIYSISHFLLKCLSQQKWIEQKFKKMHFNMYSFYGVKLTQIYLFWPESSSVLALFNQICFLSYLTRPIFLNWSDQLVIPKLRQMFCIFLCCQKWEFTFNIFELTYKFNLKFKFKVTLSVCL